MSKRSKFYLAGPNGEVGREMTLAEINLFMGMKPGWVPLKPERNDPCPCGSGRKFKRCCIGKENPERA